MTGVSDVPSIAPRPITKTIAGWLQRLTAAVGNPPEGRDVPARFAAIALACTDVPERAWCDGSLSAAMRLFRLWPAASEVREMLLGWCRDNPGPAPQLPYPGRAHWSASDWSWWRFRQRRAEEGFTGGSQALVDSLLRQYAPAVWSEISGDAGGGADWHDPAKVVASVTGLLELWCDACGARYSRTQVGVMICLDCGAELRQHDSAHRRAMGGVLAGLVQRHAPENLHLLLPEWIGEPDDAGDRRRPA